jgi:ubiquinone/menaquinone biosynthesis C-methylase UbiE
LNYERKILSLLGGGKDADEYALYKQIKDAKFGELNRAILRLKSKKLIHVTGHRSNTRMGMRIPVYSLSPNKASFDPKIEDLFEELIGGLSFKRSVEYAFVARNFSATKSGMRILDVGSESSELTRIISRFGLRQGWEVYGIDISEFEQIVNDEKPLPLLVRMDARQMGFRDNLFDRILCISMLEHIGTELLDQSADKIDSGRSDVMALSEMFRILRKGGRILITIPYIDDKVKGCATSCRIYNPQIISKLTGDFKVKKKEFYIYLNGMWCSCKRTHITKQLRLHSHEAVPNRIESRVLLCLLLEK